MRNGPYELTVAPKDYPGKKYRNKYAYAHYVVFWGHYGKIPGPLEVIHHKNGNHRDNRIENLELLSRKIHNEQHSLERLSPITLRCDFCMNEFFMKRRDLVQRVKAGRRYFFCSLRCPPKFWKLVRGTRVGSRDRTVNAVG